MPTETDDFMKMIHPSLSCWPLGYFRRLVQVRPIPFRKTGLGVLLAAVVGSASAQSVPADTKATPETVRLYTNLQRVSQKGILFGHQDDLAYGVGWQYQP